MCICDEEGYPLLSGTLPGFTAFTWADPDTPKIAASGSESVITTENCHFGAKMIWCIFKKTTVASRLRLGRT